MASSLEIPALYVEGQSDLHTLVQLLAQHGIQLDKNTGPVVIKDAKGDQGVLGAMPTAAKASTRHPVGFVIDADVSLKDRWQAVRDRLANLGLDFPQTVPSDGYIGESALTKSKVGVWIMPDNQSESGNLEVLVQSLVPAGDKLFSFARTSTEIAKSHNSKFKAQATTKAELHCWLAWQEEPGLSFGTAIKVKYLQHNCDVAKTFVAWFKTLYDIE